MEENKMKNNKSMELFSKAPVSQAVFKNALPAMAAMLMVLVYNLADTFFIGQTHDALQVAGVSLATPVFLLFMAVGTVFGIGGTSVISRAMGEGRTEYAKKVCSFCMWGCVIVGVVMSAAMLVFMKPILTLVGASADTWNFAQIYLTIVICSGPFVLISNCYSNVIRAEGESGKAMMGTLLGNLLNVILDPIFISVLGWNIAGAAIATVIGNVVGAGYYILYFLKGKSSLSISLKDLTMKDKVASSVLAIGIPAALGSLLMSISQIIINSQMAEYGDMAIAAMGVAMKVVTITGMISMGLGQGVQPLLGYCVGAKLHERFKKVLRFSVVFSLLLSVALTVLCYLFTNQIVSAFLTDATAYEYAVKFSRILLTTSCLFGVFYVITNALQAMGAATSALIINLSRQGIIFIPALFILNAAIGMTGLVWAQPVADIISLFIAFMLYLKISAKMFSDNVNDSKKA
ncbi:MATE efflux family protein [Leptotrichia sp. oral taxon 215 str. W9775]|nr:MATE efflux family protein [Leptotrichia sp. oral taxon 215 str. W9775]